MSPALLQQFQRLVSQRIGLQLRPREQEAFQTAVLARVKTLQLPGAQAYFQFLESGAGRAEREWPELAACLTNRESYFFRDQGQMALLRERILPELIERNRPGRSLRLWSAGCSTGEEAYSLGMLVEELLPRRDGWQILILGTDLNRKALEQAERGIYSPWSFRMVDPALQRRYFCPVQNGWEIAASVRRMVTFGSSNLLRDPFPDRSSGLCDMDLILCRNVFIYFEREAVSAVVSKFARTLREGGYLMTGHAETHDQQPEGLHPRRFPESLAYQRLNGKTKEPWAPIAGSHSVSWSESTSSAAPRTPPVDRPSRREPDPAPGADTAGPSSLLDLEVAESLYARGDHDAVIATLEPILEQQSHDYRGVYLLAQAYTHRGRPTQAAAMCRRASELNPLAAAPYQLLAALVEDHGDYDEAKRLLKKVIYLSPAAATAYLELGALYAREGDQSRARTMRTTGLELLRRQPPNAPMEPWGGPTAGEWVRHVEGLLAEGG